MYSQRAALRNRPQRGGYEFPRSAWELGRVETRGNLNKLAHAGLLEQFGPTLGRPHVDTLNGSRHANMKELRFDADKGVWRLACT